MKEKTFNKKVGKFDITIETTPDANPLWEETIPYFKIKIADGKSIIINIEFVGTSEEIKLLCEKICGEVINWDDISQFLGE